MKFFARYWKVLFSVLFALCVTLFWSLLYVAALSYQEQYQLFLFDAAYFLDRIALPGGLSDYVGEFLTQFYYLYQVGAVLLGLVFFLLQRLMAEVFRRVGADGAWYPLTFLPAIVLWAYRGNENVLLSFAVSLLAVEVLMIAYCAVSQYGGKAWVKSAFLALVLPLCYWLFGAVVWVLSAFVIGYEAQCHRSRDFIISILALVYIVLLVYLCGGFLQYPYYRLFGGINYFRYPGVIPWMQWVVMGAFALLPIVAYRLQKPTTKAWFVWMQAVALAVFGALFIRYSFNPVTYEMIEYDYLVRSHQWNKIIDKAYKTPATTPLSVSCVNFALAMNGQLCDRLFEFYQNGAEGLFPAFTRDMTSPVPTSEIFYQLGMINDAERYAFEAQEAIPNHRKSGRLMRRIAQCNLINGHRRVAAKYLRMLQKSLFYRRWADSQMRFVTDDAAIAADSEYGRLRKLRIQHTDYLFSDREMDQMLGMLFVEQKRYDNKMAYEYLIAYELLQRNLERFMQYYPLGQYVQYDHIPYAVQQVLVGIWVQQHGTLKGMPYSADRQNVMTTTNFFQTYMADRQSPALHQPPLSHNAWYYLLMTSGEKKAKEKMKEIY